MKYFVYVAVEADSDVIYEDLFKTNDFNPKYYEEVAKNHIYEDIALFLKNGDVPVSQYLINIVVVPTADCKQYVSIYNHKGVGNEKK